MHTRNFDHRFFRVFPERQNTAASASRPSWMVDRVRISFRRAWRGLWDERASARHLWRLAEMVSAALPSNSAGVFLASQRRGADRLYLVGALASAAHAIFRSLVAGSWRGEHARSHNQSTNDGAQFLALRLCRIGGGGGRAGGSGDRPISHRRAAACCFFNAGNCVSLMHIRM